MSMRSTIRPCPGHNTAHAQLQGMCPKTGISKTAMSMVYPPGYVRALLDDCEAFVRNFKTAHVTGYSTLWSCDRCKNGKKATTEHTRVKGCRFDPNNLGKSGMVKGAKVQDVNSPEYMKELKSLKSPKLVGGPAATTAVDDMIAVEDALDPPPDSGNARGSGDPAPAATAAAPAPAAKASPVPRRLRQKTATTPVVVPDDPGIDLAPAVVKRIVKQTVEHSSKHVR